MKPKYYALLGIFLIIGILSTLTVFMINGTNIITDPLTTFISLVIIIPITFCYLLALERLKKKRRDD